MTISMRKFQTEEDFWRMRKFLREVFLLNDCFERSWSLPRLDYWRWHFIKTVETDPMEDVTWLWEDSDGKIVAILHPIDKGEAYLHIHPHHRTAELEHEMFAIAEKHLSRERKDGTRVLFELAGEDDTLRQSVLIERGYTMRDYIVNHWYRDLDAPLPQHSVPEGYTIRSMGSTEKYHSRAWASWRAFHPDEPDEDFSGSDWFINMQSAPLYRRELDIVAEAPDGEIAAFSSLWYDDYTRSGVCVQVGTSADHWRRGLGKAVILEGLRRAKQMGAKRVFANGFDGPANALYGSALGSVYRSKSFFIELKG